MYAANGDLPVVLICHSMGCKMGHYFLNFCLQERGQAWIDKYIHTYMPVGAPHCGVSLAVRSGVTGKGLNDQVDMLLEGDDEGLVLYRSWGSGAWLMPRYLPPRTVPSCIVRREGELGIKIAAEIQVGPLFAHREKPPKTLRMTIIFRGNIRVHTSFVPVVVNAKEDVTVMFNETFYLAVPYLGDTDHLGALHFYLEEPGGRLDQNPGELRQKLRAMTSWAPVKAVKKAVSKQIRELCQKWGTVLRVAVCREPWRLLASKFVPENENADSFLEAEIQMCGCVGNDDSNPLDIAKRTVAYNDDSHAEHPDKFDAKDMLRSGVMKVTDKEIAPRLDQPIGSLLVKVKYTPPPSPSPERGEKTPVAATTPGKTPVIPIKDKAYKATADHPGQPEPVFDTWNGHDLLEQDGFCGPIWNLLEKYYEGDPLGPTTKSALYAPPVKRVRAIYGVNRETEVCAVYRHRPVVVIGDDMADSRYVLDTSASFPDKGDKMIESNTWANHNMHDYKMVNGRILETPQTLQDVPGKKEQRRVCGDGTVPYWNLVQCLNWKDEIPDMVIDELNGAEHRGILADVRFHALLKTYCRVRDPRASAMCINRTPEPVRWGAWEPEELAA
jgi:Lecithin:cholesterol acyltransferase